MEEIKQAYAWQEALELSKQLVALCEKFSDVETNVLVWHLRQAVAEVPAEVAADLQANRPATMEPAIKLMVVLELVTKIYPGVDTDEAVAQATKLVQRMRSNFSERQSPPVVENDQAEHDGEEGSVEQSTTTVSVDSVSGNHSESNEG